MFRYIVSFGLLATVALANTEGCKSARNGQKFQDPTDCRSYIQCHNGRSFNKMCWQGTKFDEEKQSCVSGKCPICNCNPGPTSPLPPISEPCKGKRYAYRYQDPEDCRGYVLCQLGNESRKLCPARKKFDEIKRTCVRGNCPVCNCPSKPSTAAPPSSSVAPTQAPTQVPEGAFDCKGNTHGLSKRDPKNCGKFWVCANNTPIERQCPEGLWYDEQRLVCNYPEIVKCPAGKY